MSDAPDLAQLLGEALSYSFRDPTLAELALSHPSFAHETDGSRGNERLEFLGDAVLDLVVGEALFEAHPDWEEGQLTRARAALVNRESLADRARELELPGLVRLGRTELRSGGAEKDSILANAFEAVVGAVYLDGGLAPVEALTRDWLEDGSSRRDPKTAFQEWAHARYKTTPSYHTVGDTGVEDDAARFRVEVRVEERSWGQGQGRSKRIAERAAAAAALEKREEDA